MDKDAATCYREIVKELPYTGTRLAAHGYARREMLSLSMAGKGLEGHVNTPVLRGAAIASMQP